MTESLQEALTKAPWALFSDEYLFNRLLELEKEVRELKDKLNID